MHICSQIAYRYESMYDVVSGYFLSTAQVVLTMLTSPQKYQIQYKSGHN